ncbi:MAG: metallophosphoesterase, partial [Fidelibacterota bacterium]
RGDDRFFQDKGSEKSPLELEIIVDDDEPGCSFTGSWNVMTWGNNYGGSSHYKERGDGSATATWVTDIRYKGDYEVFYWVKPDAFAEDASYTITTSRGDTAVTSSQYWITSGWVSLGVFPMDSIGKVVLSDHYSGAGSFIVADAIKWVGSQSTYSISGEVSFSDSSKFAAAKIEVFTDDQSTLIYSVYTQPGGGEYEIPDLIEGVYDISFSSIGYDTTWVRDLKIEGESLTDLNIELSRSSGPFYKIEGEVLLSEKSDDARAVIIAFQNDTGFIISTDTTSPGGGSFTLSDLPPGIYDLFFAAEGYLPDSTTHSDIVISDEDIELPPLTLIKVLYFAWLSDTHVGAGFTEDDLRSNISEINSMADLISFVILTGDLTEKGLSGELQKYKNILDGLSVPYYQIPGNHDTKWTESGLMKYRELFGSLMFSFDVGGVQFIGLNSGIPLRGGGGYFAPELLDWLEDELSSLQPPDKPIIAAWHHPTTGITQVANGSAALDILKDHNVILILTGHGHTNRSFNLEGVPGAMGRSSYGDKPGFNIVRVTENEIQISTHLTGLKTGSPWYTLQISSIFKPAISFSNIKFGQTLIGTANIQIITEPPAAAGYYDVSYDSYEWRPLTGSQSTWSLNLNTEQLENGFHLLQIKFLYDNGKEGYRTTGFYVENHGPRALWRFSAGSLIISKPEVRDNKVFFGTMDGKIYGLNVEDGTPLWSPYPTDGPVFSSPTFYNDKV